MTLYFALGLASIGFQVARAALMITGSIRASRKLQLDLLGKVVRLPMSFFDSQPTGGRAVRREMGGGAGREGRHSRGRGLILEVLER